MDFLESKYKEPVKLKEYNFEKFTNGISDLERVKESSKSTRGDFMKAVKANDQTNIDLETDPIQIDQIDSKYFVDNEDAIIFDLNKKKKNG